MNAILGYERSIVWHQPGTTRDVLTAATAMDGWWVEFSDVAGLRSSDDAVEAAGVARAEQEITAADLVIFVADLTTTWDDELYLEVCNRRSTAAVARAAMIVHNKCDLVDTVVDDRPRGIKTSALISTGLSDLCAAIVMCLVSTPIPPGAAVPFLPSQIESLQQALAEIGAGDLPTAQSLLATISH
jgi:tRNA modification GTPase